MAGDERPRRDPFGEAAEPTGGASQPPPQQEQQGRRQLAAHAVGSDGGAQQVDDAGEALGCGERNAAVDMNGTGVRRETGQE